MTLAARALLPIRTHLHQQPLTSPSVRRVNDIYILVPVLVTLAAVSRNSKTTLNELSWCITVWQKSPVANLSVVFSMLRFHRLKPATFLSSCFHTHPQYHVSDILRIPCIWPWNKTIEMNVMDVCGGRNMSSYAEHINTTPLQVIT